MLKWVGEVAPFKTFQNVTEPGYGKIWFLQTRVAQVFTDTCGASRLRDAKSRCLDIDNFECYTKFQNNDKDYTAVLYWPDSNSGVKLCIICLVIYL